MHRIDTPTAQKDKFGQGKNGFTNGDPATGRRATDLNSDMWDAVQEEVCTVIEAAGIQLSKGEHTQLHAAIGRLIDEQVKTRLEKNQNGADIPNKPLFLQNVGLEETINRAADALQKSQNGADIPDIDLFVRNIGAARAFNGGINIGGDSGSWTTAEFITWLESQGAFNHPYWMCKGSWAYASNKVITDTGCGNICLAGAVVEVMGTGGAITIRVTTPTTTSGGGVPSAQFIYINHGDGYAPGWRRDFSRTGDGMTGNLYLKNEGRINLAIVDEAETPRMWLFKDKGGDGVHINNGNDGGGDFVFGKEGSFYAPLAVRAGGSKMLSVRSDNNSALSAHFNLWGGGNRPTVIELDDEQGWHLYSQRNPDGTISFTVNGIVYCTALNVGGAIYQNNGDIYGSVWGNSWLSTWIHNNVVRGVRLGPWRFLAVCGVIFNSAADRW
ncbi:gp19 [Salmonella enterica subsp. arizonae]|uniref:Gp19 n=1 Tax=Salmonella enterica subsp. arizonae TaxID=59203 RepID=A0A379S424_SALER|nr:gp19 [Salmonella enterica subsp. arizonae]